MRPRLAVLITYFGERDLLRDCIQSLTAGPDRPDQIVVHDDASDAPAGDYVPSGVNVEILRAATNGGPARGRNALLRATDAEYVHFHDADDWFEPDWCSRVRQAVDESTADAVFTEVSSVYQGRIFAQRLLGLARLKEDPDLVRFCLGGSVLVPAGTYRRAVVDAVNGYREALWQAEDFDFHVRLAASGITYTVIDDPLVVIRLRAESRSQRQLEVWASAVQAVASLAEELPPRYRSDLAECAARAGSTLFKVGAVSEARRAFQMARRLGEPSFAEQPGAYRWLARTFNPELAKRVAAAYRALIPRTVRAHISQL